MADVKWIKIVTDIFGNRKIKQIESMPDADAILVIWFKLLCLAGNVNEGGLITITKDIPYTDEMLSTEFHRPLATIRLALSVFERYGMIEIIDNILCVSNWEKYQNFDTLDKIREQTRLRNLAYRERQRLQLPQCVTRHVTSRVTQCDATDKEEEGDIEKERIYCPVVAFLNEKTGAKYRASSQSTRRLIDARVNDGFTLEDFKTVISKKCAEWKGTDMEKYLRPETLFGTKFEGYLNAKSKGQSCEPDPDMDKYDLMYEEKA